VSDQENVVQRRRLLGRRGARPVDSDARIDDCAQSQHNASGLRSSERICFVQPAAAAIDRCFSSTLGLDMQLLLIVQLPFTKKAFTDTPKTLAAKVALLKQLDVGGVGCWNAEEDSYISYVFALHPPSQFLKIYVYFYVEQQHQLHYGIHLMNFSNRCNVVFY
jgi:hypothetical protein